MNLSDVSSHDPATYVHKICCAFLISFYLIVAITYLTRYIQSVVVKEERRQNTREDYN